MTEASISKNTHIETLRGLACFFLVSYHVIGPAQGGLRVPPDSILRYLVDAFVYLRMPLFTFISGYVYGLFPVNNANATKFIRGKCRRLLLPLLFVGLPFSIMQAVTPSANKDIGLPQAFLSLIIPVNHFWYLQSLFLIFVAIIFLEITSALNRRLGFVLVIISFSIIFLVYRAPVDVFSINGTLYLMPFFLLGLFVHRFGGGLLRFKLPLLASAILFFGIHLLHMFSGEPDATVRQSFFGLATGMVFCLALYASRIDIGWLARLGVYSFPIFLFHTYFTGLSRLMWRSAGVSNYQILYVLGLALGMAGPIIVYLFVKRSSWLSLLFLGKRRVFAHPVAARPTPT